MAFTCGFFNSQNGDRKYNAEQMASIFDGLIKDGVYDTVGDIFAVTPGTGMQVLVGSGRAWFDHTWNNNDAPYPLAITAADVSLPRYDAVVLETNHSDTVRTNRLRVLTGTPASNPVKPTMTSTANVKQHPLAYIKVTAGATAITQSMIQVVVGTSECPFVTGIIDTAQIDSLFQQWNGEFNEWFDNLKAQLSDNVVANLQGQIDQKVAKADVATTADIEAGTSTTKWVTPKGLKESGSGRIKTANGIYTTDSIGFTQIPLSVNSYTSNYTYGTNTMGLGSNQCYRLGDDYFIKMYYNHSNQSYIDVHDAATNNILIQKKYSTSNGSAEVYIPPYLHVGNHMDFISIVTPAGSDGTNHNVLFVCPKEAWSIESSVKLNSNYYGGLTFESETYFGCIFYSRSYTPYQYRAIVKDKISKATVYNNTVKFAGSANEGECTFLGIYGDSLYMASSELNEFAIRKWNITSSAATKVCSIAYTGSKNNNYRFNLNPFVSSSKKDKKAYVIPVYFDTSYSNYANTVVSFDYTTETCNVGSLGASDFSRQGAALLSYSGSYIGSDSMYHYVVFNHGLVRLLRNTQTIELVAQSGPLDYSYSQQILEEVYYENGIGLYGRQLINFDTLTAIPIIVKLNTDTYYDTSGVSQPNKNGLAVYAITPIPNTVPVGSVDITKNLLFSFTPNVGIRSTTDLIQYPILKRESN